MGERHFNCAECEEIYSDYQPHETCAGCDERICESCAEECRVEMPGHYCSECKEVCTGEHGGEIDMHIHQPKGCQCFDSSVVFVCSDCQGGALSKEDKFVMLEHCLAKLGKTNDEVRDELREAGVLANPQWKPVTQQEVDALPSPSPSKKRKEEDADDDEEATEEANGDLASHLAPEVDSDTEPPLKKRTSTLAQ